MFGLGKGKIELFLDKVNYTPGETINGRLVLKLNKPLESRELRVSFYGLKKETQNKYNSQQKRNVTSTHYITVYEFRVSLGAQSEYYQGEYLFSIKIPEDLIPQNQGTALKVLNVVSKGLNFLSGRSERVSWYVKATLDVPGLDLNKTIQITI